MFIPLIWGVVAVVALAVWYAYAGSKDVFHPLMFIGPMMAFMYAWMPLKLDTIGGLAGFFQRDQLDHVQWINFCGVICFVLGCLSVGARLPIVRLQEPQASPVTLVLCGSVLGCIGLMAWVMTVIHGTGGDLTGYKGGWDDSGYIRDASLLMFPAFLLIFSATLQQGFKLMHLSLLALFIAPSVLEAAFSARRGPTFMIAVVLTMGTYMSRRKRPSLLLTTGAGVTLGFLMLFLVSNRQNIYLGSDRELTTDVTSIVEKPDTGNEYIYGAGTILSAEQRNSFYWGWRYLAQVLIRPIPSSLWPTKYEDIGLPELMHNAGTGEGFVETLGWDGAEGSAPGVVADLWVEFHWLNLPVLVMLGALYGYAWRKAQLEGGAWTAQYVIMAALSVYFVMQTMEAVIFRLLILSIPLRLAFALAQRNGTIVTALETKDVQSSGSHVEIAEFV
ncbi:MAG: hypothetical protein JOZ32_09065 [Bryobacterales bacterium]|nr:hypothetical protein [Bryobacterales bacterium]